MSTNNASIASCLPGMHALTDCPRDVWYWKSVTECPAKEFAEAPGKHALHEVIAEEANKFAVRCYGATNSVDMAEIRFVCSTKFILRPL